MELKEFIEHFAEQFDDTEVLEFQAETTFKKLDEWSSLLALSIIAMIDEEYDVNVGAKEIVGSETIEDLYNTVKSLK